MRTRPTRQPDWPPPGLPPVPPRPVPPPRALRPRGPSGRGLPGPVPPARARVAARPARERVPARAWPQTRGPARLAPPHAARAGERPQRGRDHHQVPFALRSPPRRPRTELPSNARRASGCVVRVHVVRGCARAFLRVRESFRGSCAGACGSRSAAHRARHGAAIVEHEAQGTISCCWGQAASAAQGSRPAQCGLAAPEGCTAGRGAASPCTQSQPAARTA